MSWSENGNPQVVGFWGEKIHSPTLVVIGGVHGNEPSGIVALTRLLQELQQSKNNGPVQGRLVGLRGNCQALDRGARSIHQDLNRLWTEEHVERLAFTRIRPSLTASLANRVGCCRSLSPFWKPRPVASSTCWTCTLLQATVRPSRL